jgi:hypothetical protein
MAFYHDLKRYDADKARWIAERLLALRTELRASDLGRRQAGTLVIGSWNIRAFDDGTPRRDESYHYIAEIIDKFDICAVQEVKTDLDPLRRLVRLLGPNWDWFVTDVTEGDPGNTERQHARHASDQPPRPAARDRPAAHLRDHLAPRCGQDDADREIPALRRRDPDGRAGARQGRGAAHALGLHEDGAGSRHLRLRLGHVVRFRASTASTSSTRPATRISPRTPIAR